MARPLKFKTPEELQEKIAAYFESIENTDIVPTITGLAVALDTSRQTLINYEDRPEFFDAVKRAKTKIEAAIEQRSLTVGNPAGAIFNLKANFGYVDKQVVDVNAKVGVSWDGIAKEIEEAGNDD